MSAMLNAIGYFKSSSPKSIAWFGVSVAMSADGNTLAVAAGYEERVHVFTRADGQWSQQAALVTSGGPYGDTVALSSNGDILAVGAEYEPGAAAGGESAGAVYVFTRTGMQWSQSAHFTGSKVEAHDSFGRSLALSGDGRTLAVGVPFDDNGSAYVFTLADDGQWLEQKYLEAPVAQLGGYFGHRVSLSSDGTTLAVSAPRESDVGVVYLFQRDSTGWSQPISLQAPDTGAEDDFGTSLALAADGNTLAVGAPDAQGVVSGTVGVEEGTVYVFAREADHWVASGIVKAPNADGGDRFGISVALSADGSTLAVGADTEDSNAAGIGGADGNASAGADSGAAYIFRRAGTQWSQSAYVKAPNPGTGAPSPFYMSDRFGISIALSADGDTLAVGATGEDSNASGIGGDQSNNSVAEAGAVYLY
jgi:hypothetical protein